jgi:hypothetical protein
VTKLDSSLTINLVIESKQLRIKGESIDLGIWEHNFNFGSDV